MTMSTSENHAVDAVLFECGSMLKALCNMVTNESVNKVSDRCMGCDVEILSNRPYCLQE